MTIKSIKILIMAVTDFKAECFLFMVLDVLSPDGNYFGHIRKFWG